jgi:hypothetical protein
VLLGSSLGRYRGGWARGSRNRGISDLIGRLVRLEYWQIIFLVENREEVLLWPVWEN